MLFFQTPVKGPPVFMKIDPLLMRCIVNIHPKYDKYIGVDGCLVTALLKAMYGCVQLWFNLLVSILKDLGYMQSVTDPCVMHCISGSKVFIVLIHVDYLMVLATKLEEEHIRALLIVKFGDIMMDSGTSLSDLACSWNLIQIL
jgi:hypothetical protein